MAVGLGVTVGERVGVSISVGEGVNVSVEAGVSVTVGVTDGVSVNVGVKRLPNSTEEAQADRDRVTSKASRKRIFLIPSPHRAGNAG
jgi:hypothetical protein